MGRGRVTPDLLTVAEVLALLAERGRTITASTWRAYVARGQAPAPARRISRTPLWDRADVLAWATRAAS